MALKRYDPQVKYLMVSIDTTRYNHHVHYRELGSCGLMKGLFGCQYSKCRHIKVTLTQIRLLSVKDLAGKQGIRKLVQWKWKQYFYVSN